MRRLLLSLLALGAFLLPDAASAAELKIGYVNLQRALQEVDDGKAAMQRLRSQAQESQQQLDQREQALKARQDEINKKRLAMDEATLQKNLEELQREMIDATRLKAKLEQDLARAEAEATQAIFNKMQQIVRQIAMEQGYTFVFEKNEAGIVYAPDAEDLTIDLVRRYNAAAKSSNNKK